MMTVWIRATPISTAARLMSALLKVMGLLKIRSKRNVKMEITMKSRIMSLKRVFINYVVRISLSDAKMMLDSWEAEVC